MALAHQGCILRAVHAGEVKHVDVRAVPVVQSELQVRQLVVGGEVGGFLGIAEEGFLTDVLSRQQALYVRFVLREWGAGCYSKGDSWHRCPKAYLFTTYQDAATSEVEHGS